MIEKIIPLKAKPNSDAIEMLESALERVRSGELSAVGLSWVTRDGSIGGDVSASNNGLLMWASLEHNARSFYTDILMEE
jgi:hypothetical protein